MVQQFKHLSIPPFESSYLHPFTFKWLFTNEVSGNNVIAQIKTSDSNDYIVLTAHFDHIGHNGERIYNGADDNASGTAAVLAIAKQLQQNKQQLNHNILFVLTDGEESHLKGVKAFIQQQSQYVPRIKLNINLDMLAGSKHSKNLHFMSKKLDLLLNEPELQSFYQHQNYTNFRVIKGFKRQLTIENQRVSWLKASDHFGFYRVGIPIIYYGVGVHENYHTPKDTYENTNHQLLIQSANTVYHQLMLLDQLI
nr:M20/M25/M40 family metallo-hydrolase [Thalassotalea sp. G2M2-11]